MIKIGDVCPLFFNPVKNSFQQDISYIQRYYTTDKILIQIFSNAGENVSVFLNNLVKGESTVINLSRYEVNGSVMMYYATLSQLPDALYSITINSRTSEPFEVCSDEELLRSTTLIRYSHKDNNSPFDNVFWIDREQQIFEWRIEAGFKPGGYSPKVDVEQYRNQEQELENLYAVPYDGFVLSCGDSDGLPYWYARHLNRILCLSMFEVGGERYVRSETAVPELSPLSDDSQTFFMSVSLEPQTNDIAGIGGIRESSSGSLAIGWMITDPKDGEMLAYSEQDAAFKNVNRI